MLEKDATNRLIVLPQSPWSERARWALDHHGLGYRLIEHVPFLGERRLRRLVGHPKGRATVPVLLAAGEVFANSWDIACYADREGRGEKLIPADVESEAQRWNGIAEQAMIAARALTVHGLLASGQALQESLPAGTPGFLRPVLRPLARYGTKWFARKYALNLGDTETPKRALREALEQLRKAIIGSGYVLARFSYADIVMASVLQAVVPVSDRYLRLGPATRGAWTQADMAAAYDDLVAWRDGLYERHRLPRRVPSAA
jgi:glutathione S-transferase